MVIESNSSMKTIEGECLRAESYKGEISFDDSPKYFERMLLTFTLKNVDSRLPAVAAARSVFPVPGGPKRRMPLSALMDSGLLATAIMIVSFMRFFVSFNPPISFQVTLDFSIKVSPKSLRSSSLVPRSPFSITDFLGLIPAVSAISSHFFAFSK